jgi:hypothetical protein
MKEAAGLSTLFPSASSKRTASTAPARVDWPLKVTSEFCAMQDRFSALSLESIVVPERGMEKLALDSAMSLGMALPRVTSLILVDPSDPTRLVVVQASLRATVQTGPEKPLVHMHEQTPCEMTLVPPF